mgnify:CR=1 FL=1
MARPKRGNFATGEAGLARYKEALRKYLAKTKKTTKPEVKKPVAKKPVAKKPATKKPATKKPVAKKTPVKKPVAKKPATTTKPKRTANQLKIKKVTTTAQKAIKKATPVVKKAVQKGKTFVKNQKAKFAKDQTPQQANPAPKTKGQKLMSRINKSYQNYSKEVMTKAKADFGKDSKLRKKDPSLKGRRNTNVKAAIAMEGGRRLTDAVFNRLGKPKDMTVKQYAEAKEKMRSKRNLLKDSLKIAKGIRNKFRGKSGDSPITKKTISKAPNRTEKQKSDLQIAKDRAKKAKGYNKEKLQREVRYQEKFGKQGRTWSNPVGAKGKGKPTSVKADNTSTPTKKYGRAPKGYIKSGSKFVSLRTAQGKKALNKQKARERAQAAARERLRKKKQNQ